MYWLAWIRSENFSQFSEGTLKLWTPPKPYDMTWGPLPYVAALADREITWRGRSRPERRGAWAGVRPVRTGTTGRSVLEKPRKIESDSKWIILTERRCWELGNVVQKPQAQLQLVPITGPLSQMKGTMGVSTIVNGCSFFLFFSLISFLLAQVFLHARNWREWGSCFNGGWQMLRLENEGGERP